MKSLVLHRIATVAGASLFAGLLQWAYPNIMVPTYYWAGMTYRQPEPAFLVLQNLLALVPALWLPLHMRKPSHFQWWLLYLTVIVPTCIVPFHVVEMSSSSILVFLVVLFACFAVMCRFSTLRPLPLPRLPLGPTLFWGAIGAFSLLTYGLLWVYVGPLRFVPAVHEVYGLRSQFETALGSAPAVLRYCYWWQGLVVTPTIVAAGLVHRRLWLLGLGLAMQVALFAATTLQTFVLAFFLQVGFGVLVLCSRRRLGVTFLYGMILCTVAAIFWYGRDPYAFGPLVFLQRWIFVPGQLTAYYLHFFSQHRPTWLGQSLLGGLFAYPYDLLPSRLIGREYLAMGSAPGDYTNATANMWADAFGAFGYLGLIGFSLLGAGIMWAVDSAFQPLNPRFGLLLICVVGQAYAGEGVLTSLLTGGVVPLILIGLVSRATVWAPKARAAVAPSRKENPCQESST